MTRLLIAAVLAVLIGCSLPLYALVLVALGWLVLQPRGKS